MNAAHDGYLVLDRVSEIVSYEYCNNSRRQDHIPHSDLHLPSLMSAI